MSEVQCRAGWWPTVQQELLLRAALCPGTEAVDAWEQWNSTINLDTDMVDNATFRILPLIYHNLNQQGYAGPQMQRLKGIYRYWWSKNQLYLHKLHAVVTVLWDAGIETLALKGCALMLEYYQNVGLRPIQDIDVLVRVNQRDKALAVLDAAGLTRKDIVPDSCLPLIHAIAFEDRDKTETDLHWYVLPETCYPGADDDFWDAALIHSLNGLPVRILNPADQFFHACVHGARWNPMPSMRWVADAVTIFRATEALDWERVVEQAAKRHLSLRLRSALEYLVDVFDVPIPPSVIEALRRIDPPALEVKEFAALQRQHEDWDMWRRFLYYHYTRERSVLAGAPYAGTLGFLNFMKAWWGLSHTWELPFFLAQKMRQSLAKERAQNAP